MINPVKTGRKDAQPINLIYCQPVPANCRNNSYIWGEDPSIKHKMNAFNAKYDCHNLVAN